MTRRQVLQRLAGAALSGCVAQRRTTSAETSGKEDRSPNFVFILADDLGWADLGCYGNAFIETPHIDRLAAEGMRFTDAYAAAPVCSPTRASIMTGRYPARIGVYDFIPGHLRPWAKLKPPANARTLPLEDVTLAEALAPAGYVSCSIGKWHLGKPPTEQGFAAEPSGPPPVDRPAAYADALARFARENPGKRVGPLTEKAVRFIEENRDRPFLCFLSHNAVHIPVQARGDLCAKYKAKAAAHPTEINPDYAAMTEAMDDSVGLILQALDALNLADRTVVIFFSDNGGLGRIYTGQGPFITVNTPLRDEKGTLYEGGIRVPLIVRWPGAVKAGSVCRGRVISTDFLPTLGEIAGAPDRLCRTPDGVSIVRLLRDTGAPGRDTLYWHYPTYHHSTPASAIREDYWKLLEFFEDGRVELYNLKEDIGEKHNLAEEEPDRAAYLRGKLAAWRKSINAPMPTPNPAYDPARAAEWGRRQR